MKKRLLGIFLTVCMVLALLPSAALAVPITPAEELQSKLGNSAYASVSGDTVTLLQDVTLTETLSFTSGTIILDLSGKTINGKQGSAGAYGNNYGKTAISVNGGKLTIKDSVGGGVVRAGSAITGFWTEQGDGGIALDVQMGTVNIEGGRFIGGNGANNAGAIGYYSICGDGGDGLKITNGLLTISSNATFEGGISSAPIGDATSGKNGKAVSLSGGFYKYDHSSMTGWLDSGYGFIANNDELTNATYPYRITYTATITLNANFGTTPATSSQVYVRNVFNVLPENTFTRTGYIFKEWNTQANGTGSAYLNKASIYLTANTTLYAIWTKCNHNASTQKPTCTQTAICSVCGATIPTIPHSYASGWSKDANNHWHECTCGDKEDLAAHTQETINAKEATTTEKGYTGDTVCSVCGYEIAKGEDIAVKVAPTPAPTEPKPEPTAPITAAATNIWMWAAAMFVSGIGIFGIINGKHVKKQESK